jgi:sugar/nucleoside kinase (ribokinase family)
VKFNCETLAAAGLAPAEADKAMRRHTRYRMDEVIQRMDSVVSNHLAMTTSLDCNRQVLRHVDMFLPNETEALRLTGKL